MTKVIATIALDKKSILNVTLLSLLLGALAIPYVLWLSTTYSLAQRAPRHGNLALFIFMCIGTLIVHEALHGLAYTAFGAHPKFGAKLIAWIMPVLTTSAKGTKLIPVKMIIVGLSPFIFITIATSLLATMPQLASYMIAAFCVNFVGSVGDIYMVIKLLKYIGRPNHVVEDTGTAFIVIQD